MNTLQGFTLMEVLISLCLITATSLGLLTHQWQVNQIGNQAFLHSHALRELDNHTERVLSFAVA